MQIAFEDILCHQRLTPLFQPIVDISGQRIVGYEALIRGPQYTPFYSPVVLFKEARRLGKERELEQLCCRLQVEAFVRLGLQGRLFINLSPLLFIDLSCLPLEQKPWHLEGQSSQPAVVIELSEQELSREYMQLRLAAQRCRRENVQIAIDDLGEGYASLRLWSELQPEYVKLDRYFTQHLHRHPFKRALLEAVNKLAIDHNMQVIAEGIEQKVQLDALLQLGISHAQGYYFGYPVALPDEAELLKLLRG